MIAPIEHPAPVKLLVTMVEAAEMLSCCERTISRLIERGELRPVKVGPRGVRVAVDDLRAWIQRQQAAVQP